MTTTQAVRVHRVFQPRSKSPLKFVGETWLINIGPKHIWDGADLALLRELQRSIAGETAKRITIDMSGPMYLHTGFFGMLWDWSEAGWEVLLSRPSPTVQGFLWFEKFFQHVEGDVFQLRRDGGA